MSDDRGMRRGKGDRALCIGINDYKSSPLRNAVNDATAVAGALSTAGFEVKLLTDATLKEMLDALEGFVTTLQRGSAGVFYFAGHGCQARAHAAVSDTLTSMLALGASFRSDKRADLCFNTLSLASAASSARAQLVLRAMGCSPSAIYCRAKGPTTSSLVRRWRTTRCCTAWRCR